MRRVKLKNHTRKLIDWRIRTRVLSEQTTTKAQ